MAEDFPPPPVIDQTVHTQALRTRTRIRVRWETIAVLVVVAAVAFVLGMGTQWRIDNYIPPCTDKIATEGGICQGPLG